jgi:hypothetical protein
MHAHPSTRALPSRPSARACGPAPEPAPACAPAPEPAPACAPADLVLVPTPKQLHGRALVRETMFKAAAISGNTRLEARGASPVSEPNPAELLYCFGCARFLLNDHELFTKASRRSFLCAPCLRAKKRVSAAEAGIVRVVVARRTRRNEP